MGLYSKLIPFLCGIFRVALVCSSILFHKLLEVVYCMADFLENCR
jgi:hypothetical protein